MMRAANKVIEGTYRGKRVCHAKTAAFICVGLTETIELNRSTIEEVEIIDESSEISVANAATRGFIGEMLFGPIGLAAAGTARRDERYIVGIVFRDGQRSVLDVDGDLFRMIAASVEK